MNYTENLTLGLPEYGEDADVADLNRNSGILDAYCYNTRQIECEPYDSTKTYMSGDLSIHNEVVYECNTDNTTGTWDDSKWDSTTLAEQIAKAKQSGGESEFADLDDVSFSNLSNGQTVKYNTTSQKWENTDFPDTDVTKEASGNPIEFTDGADAPLVKCVTQITGSQDLHGYDKPWVGGAEKNKLPLVLADIKTANTNGTWSGNQYLYNGVTFTVLMDEDENITGIKANGTATSQSSFAIMTGGIGDGMIVNGCPANGSTDTYYMVTGTSSTRTSTETGSGATISGSTDRVIIRIEGTITVQNLVFLPMIRLSTVTDPTFAPYSNICPITAYTEGEIEVMGKNMFNQSNPNKWINADGDLISDTGSIVSQLLVAHPNQEYILSSSNSTSILCICFYDNSMTKLLRVAQSGVRQLTATAPNGSVFMYAGSYKSNNNIQLEFGTTVTAYEPYKGTTHTTTYPSAIYRGSEDVVNGTETHDMVVVDLGDLFWSYDNSNNYFGARLTELKNYNNGDTPNMACEAYQVINARYGSTMSGAPTGTICPRAEQNWLQIKDTNYTDATLFKTSVTGYKLAYELATPTTSSVTPTNLPIKSLSGYNHIESSTGDMEVEYITSEYQPLVDLIQSSKHVYSTQEQIVGTWIDGKTLYEMTVHATGITYPTNTSVSVHDFTDKFVVQFTAQVVQTDGSKIPLPYFSAATEHCHIWATDTQFRVNQAGYSITDLFITYRYTKPSESVQTRSLSAPVTSQKAQIEPLTDKTEEVPTEEEKAVNEEENTNENR